MSAVAPDPVQPGALFPHTRPSLRPAEVLPVLGVSRQQLAKLEEQGLVAAFGIGDGQEPKRQHLRFVRASVEGYHALRLELRGHQIPFALSAAAAQWREHLRRSAKLTCPHSA
jgi:hypothetical protein